MTHMDLVRARMADPQTDIDANARNKEVNHRLRSMYANEIGLALQHERDTKKRFIWLKKLGTVLGKAMDGIAPCRDGCSHCCNMATIISLQEATAIAKATGRKMTVPKTDVLVFEDIEADRAKYNGVPCTQLKDGRCSIYEHRPWACRSHYVLDHDNLLCEIKPGETIIAPHYNNEKFTMLYYLAHNVNPLDIQLADIRDFFPEPA